MVNPTVNPTVGYSTNAGAGGPQTREQWIAMMTASLTLRFLNGEDMTEPEMADAWFAQHGFNVQALHAAFGVLRNNPDAAIDPYIQTAMAAAADAVYQRSGINLPSEPGSGPIADPVDRNNIAQGTQQAAQDAAANARNAATNQANIDIAKIQSGDNRYDTDTRAAVDRERIAADVGIANADRASREKIAADEEAGRNRRFDLQLAEDRRQFNVSIVTDLFKTGVELAKNPVDWIGYAYFNEKIGLPLSALGIGASAMLFGAVPPTGPSAAGPMVGGPAVLDGDLELARQVGAQNPGLVPVSQAVQRNPGSGQQFGVAQYTAPVLLPEWSAKFGGTQGLDQALAFRRMQELPRAVGNNPVLQASLDQEAAIARPPVPEALGTNEPNRAVAADGMPDIYSKKGAANGAFGAKFEPQQAPGMGSGQRPILVPDGGPTATPLTAAEPPGDQATGIPMPQGQNPILVTENSDPRVVTGGDTPQQPGWGTIDSNGNPNGGYMPSNGAPGTSTGGSGSGIYTGPSASPPAGQPGTGAQNPQGNQLLQTLAQQLGIPYEQISQVVNPALLGGGYSLDAIRNSPAIQAINNQTPMSAFRTAPTNGEKFGTIQAFGIPLGGPEYGFRGGQDLNAAAYLKSPKYGQQMIEGAVKATGQSWPDVMEQSLRTSPIANYETGAFGRRRF